MIINEGYKQLGRDYTEQELQQRADAIYDELTQGKTPPRELDEPCEPSVTFAGGLPGAGKTGATGVVAGELKEKGGIIEIDPDEFRRHHPKNSELARIGRLPEVKAEQPDYYALQTQKFAGEVKKALIERLSDRGYNLVIQGTIKDAENPIKTAKQLKAKGYTATAVIIVPTDRATAREGTIKRYEKALEREKRNPDVVARAVGEPYFEECVKGLQTSIRDCHESGAFDRMRFIDRDGITKYDSEIHHGVDPQEYANDLIIKGLDYDLPLPQGQLQKCLEDKGFENTGATPAKAEQGVQKVGNDTQKLENPLADKKLGGGPDVG